MKDGNLLEETPDEKFKREMREYEGKNIQDYSVRLTAWFSTKLEKDKSLLTISSAAVGLLVSIIIAKGVQDYYQIIFYSLALLGFLIAIITVINIFDKNAEQIEMNLMDGSHINTTLSKYDMTLAGSFYIGIFCTILIGISYAVNQYVKDKQTTCQCLKQGGNLSDEKDKFTQQKLLNDSFKESNNIKAKPPTINTIQPKRRNEMGREDLQKVVKDDQLEKLERSFKGSNTVRPPTPTPQGNSNSSNTKKEE